MQNCIYIQGSGCNYTLKMKGEVALGCGV